jgi:hypothetical protein
MRMRREKVLWEWRKICIDVGMLTRRDFNQADRSVRAPLFDFNEADKSVRAPLFGALLYSAL